MMNAQETGLICVDGFKERSIIVNKITLGSVLKAILGIAVTAFVIYMLYDLSMNDGQIFMAVFSVIKALFNQILKGLYWIKERLEPFSFNPQISNNLNPMDIAIG